MSSSVVTSNSTANNHVRSITNRFEQNRLEGKPPLLGAQKPPQSRSSSNRIFVKRTPAFRLAGADGSPPPVIAFQRSNSQSQISYKRPNSKPPPPPAALLHQRPSSSPPPPMVKSKSSIDFSEVCARIRAAKKITPPTTSLDLYTEPIPKLLREPTNAANSVVVEALRRPLPPGPAPRKPPRTFTHQCNLIKTDSNQKQDNLGPGVINVNNHNSKGPKYMLSRLEQALRTNRLRTSGRSLIKPSSLRHRLDCMATSMTTTSGEEEEEEEDMEEEEDEDSDDSLLYRSKNKNTPLMVHLNRDRLRLSLNCPSGRNHIQEAEPIYTEPKQCLSKATTNNNCTQQVVNTHMEPHSLHYMSTSLLNEDNFNGKSSEICSHLKQTNGEKSNRNHQVSTENLSLSSNTSDLDSADSTPVAAENGSNSIRTTTFQGSSTTKRPVQNLIRTFEEAANHSNNNNNGGDQQLTSCNKFEEHSKPTSPNQTQSAVNNNNNNNNVNRVDALRHTLEQTLDHCFQEETRIVDKFETYVRTMPKYQRPSVSRETLFHCVLLVEWYQGAIRTKFKFPANVEVPYRIDELCYPEATSGPLDRTNSAQCYTLAITNAHGDRKFGYCRRVIPNAASTVHAHVQTQAPTNSTSASKHPLLAYCLLSEHRAPRLYDAILRSFETYHHLFRTHKSRADFIARFYWQRYPQPGHTVRIDVRRTLPQSYLLRTGAADGAVADHVIALTLHRDTRYEDADLKPLHHHLSAVILLKIFSSLLLERKVILISCIISKVSCCVDALQSVLYPFRWPHTFIPILPQCLWDIVEAPTPLLCGILSVAVVNQYRIENALVVDLDEGSVLIEEGDEDRILCSSMQKVWHKGMAMANTIPRDEYVHSVYLGDAYIQVFVMLLRNYKNFIVNGVFQASAMIRSAKSKGLRRFLKWFTQTAMFLAFTETVIANPNSFTVFDRKIEMYGSEQSSAILDKLLEWKM